MSDELRKYWHPVAAVDELDGGPIRATLLDEGLVVFQVDGEVFAMQDLCVHRGTKLSMGTLNADGCLVCPYHGWTYDTSGKCVYIPSQPPDDQKIGKGTPPGGELSHHNSSPRNLAPNPHRYDGLEFFSRPVCSEA